MSETPLREFEIGNSDEILSKPIPTYEDGTCNLADQFEQIIYLINVIKGRENKNLIGFAYKELWLVNVARNLTPYNILSKKMKFFDADEVELLFLMKEKAEEIRKFSDYKGHDKEAYRKKLRSERDEINRRLNNVLKIRYEPEDVSMKEINISVLEEIAHTCGYNHGLKFSDRIKTEKFFFDVYEMRTPKNITIDLD
jgi:hypothetical protein